MSDVVIKAESIGKKYIIGHKGNGSYKTIREQIMHHFHNIYSRTKQMVTGQQILEGDNLEEFWALQKINLEIRQGERVGIIGKNGAGKSTLLKILSRITEPTAGKVSIKGRVASLLEVGTGFHHELTGRENIFLNGAILGMSRNEIKKRFDEIVEFSSVEKFLDTPVKRYSSGMYVRLAFAIAAHLESEILIVDEVLAVGDAEFQKKCFVKMDEVSKSGRTILFVSHQLNSVMNLCQRSMVLDKGQMLQFGETSEVIDFYLTSINNNESGGEYKLREQPTHGKEMYFESVIAVDKNQKTKPVFFHDESICLLMKIKYNIFINGSQVWVSLLNKQKKRVFTSFINIDEKYVNSDNGLFVMIDIPPNTIAPNKYSFLCSLEIPGCPSVDVLEDICPINVLDAGSELASQYGFDYGDVLVKCSWTMK